MIKKTSALLVMLMIAASLLAAGRTIELEVFRDWRGNDCQFKSSRPFFTITDIYDLERFWNQANLDEPMPWLDFEKSMLFVWNPGPSLFDHHPVRVDKFLYRNGQFFVVMDLEKKAGGGYWRRPFVATLLPKIKKGDIHIMRKDQVAYNQVKFRHVYTLWDMSSDRSMPFEVAKLDTPEKKPEFIDPSRHPRDLAGASSQMTSPVARRPATAAVPAKPVAQTTRPPAAAAAKPAAAKTEAADSGFEDLFGSSTRTASSPAAKKPEAEKKQDDFMPDFDPPAKAAKAEVKPAAKTTAPAPDEDPLFGEEFDINF